VTTPRPSVVLRRLADEAVRRYGQHRTPISQMDGIVSGGTLAANIAIDTARTCAYSHAASLRAVADAFERCEAEDEARELEHARELARLSGKLLAANFALGDREPEAPVSGVAE
jgi:hypothetical protein